MNSIIRILIFVSLLSLQDILCQDVDPTQKAFLNNLLQDYDVNEWPDYRREDDESIDETTNVEVQIFVNSFGSLNAANMDYTIDMFLRQRWVDKRLVFKKKTRDTITVTNHEMQEKIWKPDTFFQNVKSAHFHQVTMPNKLLRISHDGQILYSLRTTLTLSCNLELQQYPFDSQTCFTNLSSYANTDDIIKYSWYKHIPIDMPDDLEIAQFDLIKNSTDVITFEYATGNFSGLLMSFVVKRQNGYHVLQTYVPTILIVSISWVSFWLDANAVPGRVSLGVTTLLTLTTLASGIRQQLPPVSYIKAIDVWVGMCMIMVFGALLEFTVANWLANKKVITKDSPIGEETTLTYKVWADYLDKSCRWLFPGIFLVFNLTYWPYYLS